MERRRLLKLGLAAGAVLAVGGSALALIEPGVRDGALTPAGRRVFRALGTAFLEGSLPAQPQAQGTALDGLLVRIDALVASLPGHAQAELSQLLALLDSTAGRRALAAVPAAWDKASVAEMQAGLQDMRLSSVSLRQQAYHALHDITFGAYFSDASTWGVLGYPGPIKI